MMRRRSRKPLLKKIKVEVKEKKKEAAPKPTKGENQPTYVVKSSPYLTLTPNMRANHGVFDPFLDLIVRDRIPHIHSEPFSLEWMCGKEKEVEEEEVPRTWDNLLVPTNTKHLVGLDSAIALLRHFLVHPTQVGCVIDGPIGCGKTTMVQLVCKELGKKVTFYSDEEDHLFSSALQSRPTSLDGWNGVLVLDNCLLSENKLNSILLRPACNQHKWIVVMGHHHHRRKKTMKYNALCLLSSNTNISIQRPTREMMLQWGRTFPNYLSLRPTMDKCLSTNCIDVRSFVLTTWFASMGRHGGSNSIAIKDNHDPSCTSLVSNTFKRKQSYHALYSMPAMDTIGMTHVNLLTVAEQKMASTNAHVMDDVLCALDYLSDADIYIHEVPPVSSVLVAHAIHRVSSVYRYEDYTTRPVQFTSTFVPPETTDVLPQRNKTMPCPYYSCPSYNKFNTPMAAALLEITKLN